jgi:SSS family solute:Na+ symporter
MCTGTGMALARDLKSSIYPLHIGGHVFAVYAAIPALIANLFVTTILTLLLDAIGQQRGQDTTLETEYVTEEA